MIRNVNIAAIVDVFFLAILPKPTDKRLSPIIVCPPMNIDRISITLRRSGAIKHPTSYATPTHALPTIGFMASSSEDYS